MCTFDSIRVAFKYICTDVVEPVLTNARARILPLLIIHCSVDSISEYQLQNSYYVNNTPL